MGGQEQMTTGHIHLAQTPALACLHCKYTTRHDNQAQQHKVSAQTLTPVRLHCIHSIAPAALPSKTRHTSTGKQQLWKPSHSCLDRNRGWGERNTATLAHQHTTTCCSQGMQGKGAQVADSSRRSAGADNKTKPNHCRPPFIQHPSCDQSGVINMFSVAPPLHVQKQTLLLAAYSSI